MHATPHTLSLLLYLLLGRVDRENQWLKCAPPEAASNEKQNGPERTSPATLTGKNVNPQILRSVKTLVLKKEDEIKTFKNTYVVV